MSFGQSISFIGAGKMATAIAGGLIQHGWDPSQLKACDVNPSSAKAFHSATGVEVLNSHDDVVPPAEIVVLSVKPQVAAGVLKQLRGKLEGKLLLSIAAGIPIPLITELSGHEKVVRVMPNTPALVGAGMSCYAAADCVPDQWLTAVESFLSAFGRCRRVAEAQLDAVTGLSGSAPAFVLEFIMGLADGGVYAGLPRDMALELAAQTVFGSAKMCLESNLHPAQLRDAVISPAGTTARGIMTLEKAGFSGIVASAVVSAAKRSADLSKGK